MPFQTHLPTSPNDPLLGAKLASVMRSWSKMTVKLAESAKEEVFLDKCARLFISSVGGAETPFVPDA